MKTIHITENAVRNHDELFPNHESKLQKTDPEFIELFDNWAFDEVIRQSQLDAKTRVMMILASTIASQSLGEYRVMVGAALNVGLIPVVIKEILYQSVPYVGVAKNRTALGKPVHHHGWNTLREGSRSAEGNLRRGD